MLKLVLGLSLLAFLIILVVFVYLFGWRRDGANTDACDVDIEKNSELREADHEENEAVEGLVAFQGGEDLTICEILDAPGEVIGKSNYGTLYKALLQRINSLRLLRFLRPVCTEKVHDFDALVQLLGQIRHPNLVPLLGFYGGPRGEKLLVHPYYKHGNLSDLIRDGDGELHEWSIIYSIATGIAKALDHLHNELEKPLVHGNLKSKNILLDRNCQPHVSDFGTHLLLNPGAAQEMLEVSSLEGYKAPEVIKMRDVSEGADIYCLGVVLLELLTGREPVNEKGAPGEDYYLPSLLRHAVLGRRITDLFHPNIFVSNGKEIDKGLSVEERVLKFFQLAMACCSPSPTLRPNIKQVLWKLEEIGR